jgi:hypothetical protein
MEYFMIILNCKKYNHKRERQRSGWLSTFTEKTGIQYFHIIGDEGIAADYIVDSSNNIITVKCPDTYIALPMKSYLAVKAVTESYPSMKMVFKTDDDMDCNVDALIAELSTIKQNDYGGEYLQISREHMSTYHYPNVPEDKRTPFYMKCTVYCPGRFYFLSKNVCEIIVRLRGHFEGQIFEDYAVGFIASKITRKLYFFNVKQIFREGV